MGWQTWGRRIRAQLLHRNGEAFFERAAELFKAGDHAQAAAMMLQAARMDNAQAAYFLARMLEAGQGVQQDQAEGARWFARAAERGHRKAMVALGRKYWTGEGVARDPAKGMHWMRRAAEDGDATAQVLLGLAWREGKAFPPDLAQSAQWFRNAALQREPTACHMLGIAFENGEGVKQDLQEALLWQMRAAECGHALGQYNLARLYAKGIGTRVDEQAATLWFARAAEQGDADAQFSVALRYLQGQGAPANAAQAAQWMAKAAGQGHAPAMASLGVMYADGTGIDQNTAESMRWLASASQRGLDVDDALKSVVAHRLQAMAESNPPTPSGERAQPAEPHDGAAVELPAEHQPTDFRRQSCFFAFHLFPGWLLGGSADANPLTLESLRSAVDRLWDEAGRLESALGPAPRREQSRPICKEHVGVAGTWWSVRMPLALKAPEPSVLIVGLGSLGPGLHLAEVWSWPMRPLAWCRTDSGGSHAVLGWLEESKREAVVRELVEHGRVTLKDSGIDRLSQHLCLYVETAHEIQHAAAIVAGGAVSPTVWPWSTGNLHPPDESAHHSQVVD